MKASLLLLFVIGVAMVSAYPAANEKEFDDLYQLEAALKSLLQDAVKKEQDEKELAEKELNEMMLKEKDEEQLNEMALKEQDEKELAEKKELNEMMLKEKDEEQLNEMALKEQDEKELAEKELNEMMLKEKDEEQLNEMALKEKYEKEMEMESRDAKGDCMSITNNCNDRGTCVKGSSGGYSCRCASPFTVGGPTASCVSPMSPLAKKEEDKSQREMEILKRLVDLLKE